MPKPNEASSAALPADHQEDRGDAVGLMRRPAAQAWVSALSSVAIHGAVILMLAFFVVANVVRDSRKSLSQIQLFTPESSVIQDVPGGIPNPGPDADPSRMHTQNQDPTSNDPIGTADVNGAKINGILIKSAVNGDTGQIGVSSHRGGVGTPGGIGTTIGGDDGGKIAPFGGGGGGDGIGIRSILFGNGGAHSICYVCDGSGSMSQSGKDEVLRVQLGAAIGKLAPLQQFNVLLFQEAKEGVTEYQSLGDHLQMATPNNKQHVFDFVQNVMAFHGKTNAVPALKEAFREKPQLIYLLTDGLWESPGPDGPGMLKLINQLNADKSVKVDTILLFANKKEETDNAGAAEIMKQIADQNGGTFKSFSADRL